ncbi:TRPM8 channel-associated factor homolog [Anabas testudineus]|uniref:TRPM8 channel-associated factor homolog n=1 Tax=Anabas testudineus TaxID=64144 RepID=UPI000E453F2B|nr:TRPM8 channel-associated factor homolog [Anabas testudineus]XP_026224866.1 TRPM8 channel-associated factor homolog [Anabas testudineus]
MALQHIQPHHEAYMFLTKGLRELDFRGTAVPCDLLLTGDKAFPLAMNSQGQVLMAASLYGRGRIVVLSHEVYLTTFPALVENALMWLRGDGSDNLSVGVQKHVEAVADNLNKSQFQVKVVEAFSENLGVGVYVTNAYSVGEDPKDLVAFLKSGGGVLIAGQAWYWAACHPKENIILRFPGNKVSSVAGIYFSSHYGAVEILPVYPQIPSSWMAVKVGKKFEDDLEFLLKGISDFKLRNGLVASEVLVHGPLSFPIGTTEDGRVFLAGAYYGQGRVVVISHEAHLKEQNFTPVWNNVIQWLNEDQKGVIGVSPDLDEAFNNFSKVGFNCVKTKFRKDLSVYVCTAYTDENMEEIQDFVAGGGGLLMGGHAWSWTYNSGKNPMKDFSGNKILNKMGLSLLKQTIDEGSNKAPVLSQDTTDNSHFCHRLRRVAGHVIKGEELTKSEEQCLKKLGSDCASYLHMKAYDWYSYTQVVSTLSDILKKAGMPQVNEKNPVKNPKDHLLLSLGAEVFNVCADPDALLPYLIKESPVMPDVYNQRIKINVKTAEREEWISTGLYLPSGLKTYMIIPTEIINKGWRIQVGCQTDYLNAEELSRAPCVYEQFPINTEMMQVWNLLGGLLYLVAPPDTQVEGVEVIVQMAVSAPYYKCGETTAADWSLLRKAPSPWAELEFENVILTVPSDVVRSLEHPDELAKHWNAIMNDIADLAAIPRKFARKERFVTDVQISAGWMHAGYPIMAHKPTADDLVNIDSANNIDLWGPIHELGHNQQRDCWEFPPHTTDCTCNLWSVYVHEEMLKRKTTKVQSAPPTEEAHPQIDFKVRKKRVEDYAKGGRNLNNWDMWVALETYLQLQEKFGWDAFKKVFAAYHDMTNVPNDNKGKMNLYAETFSQTVQMNLCGFFKAWGWPIETSTEEKLSNLPSWTDHPMVQYD